MDLNYSNIIRSAAFVVVGLPLSASVLLGVMEMSSETLAESRTNSLKAELTVPCVKWLVSKNKSDLEMSARDSIDRILNGEGIDYKGLCEWVI